MVGHAKSMQRTEAGRLRVLGHSRMCSETLSHLLFKFEKVILMMKLYLEFYIVLDTFIVSCCFCFTESLLFSESIRRNIHMHTCLYAQGKSCCIERCFKFCFKKQTVKSGYFIFNYAYMSVYQNVYVGASGSQKRVLDPLELEFTDGCQRSWGVRH